MIKSLTVAAGFAISLSLITSSATADPYPWCAAYGTPGGTNCGFLTIEQCRATLAETAVSASQTNSTPDPKPHPAYGNKSAIGANARRHDLTVI